MRAYGTFARRHTMVQDWRRPLRAGAVRCSNDPEGATVERGRVLLEAIVERVAARARALLTDTTSGENR